MNALLKALRQFCSYVFVPQKRPKDYYDILDNNVNVRE